MVVSCQLRSIGAVMAEEKNQGAGTATVDAPVANMVQVTFLPEGKTVQFEHGKLPYKDHGKEESLLDVALNHGIRLDMAADLQLNSRLGCQAVINKPGKVVVEIPAWNRNYVSEEH